MNILNSKAQLWIPQQEEKYTMGTLYRTMHTVAIVSVAAVSVPMAAQAQGAIVEQIEMALELYHLEDYAGAIAELEYTIDDIRGLIADRIGSTFPGAPIGWNAQDVQSAGGGGAAAMMFGGAGTVLERGYREDGGNGRMEATLMVDVPMVQGMAGLFSNPALLTMQPDTDRVRIGREAAIVKWEPDHSRAEVTLFLDGRILLQVKGHNLASQDPAVELMRHWDLAAVRAHIAR